MYGGVRCFSRLVTQRPFLEGVGLERMESDEEPSQLLAPDDPNRRQPWSRTEVEEVGVGVCLSVLKHLTQSGVSSSLLSFSAHVFSLHCHSVIVEFRGLLDKKKKRKDIFCANLVLWTKIQPSLHSQVIPPASLFVIDKRFHLSNRLFLSLTLPADKKQDRAIKLDCFSARVVNTRPKLNLFIKLFICGGES